MNLRNRRPTTRPAPGRAFDSRLLVLLALLLGCQAVQDAADRLRANVQKPRAELTGARVAGLRPDGAELEFDVRVENPYGVSIPLVDVGYALASGGAEILRGSVDHPGTLPPNGTRELSVPVRLTFSSLFEALSSVRPGSLLPYEAEVNLAVEVPAAGRVELPLRYEGSLPVPAVPEVSIQALRVENSGLSEIALTLDTEIRNPNSFPLDLSDLDVGLELAGARVADLSARVAGSLGPGGATNVSLPLRLSLASGGRALLSLLRGNAAEYRLTGRLAAGTPYGPIEWPLAGQGQAPISR